MFFLSKLKGGDRNDNRVRKALVAILINKIYLYDDRKIIIVFNVGDTTVEITGELEEKVLAKTIPHDYTNSGLSVHVSRTVGRQTCMIRLSNHTGRQICNFLFVYFLCGL
jgi:hypothetical protein